MTCESIRETLLELGWGAADRERAARALKHLETCAQCREAIGDFDVFRDAFDSPGDQATPQGGWDAFEDRLEARALATGHSWRWPMAIAASVLIVAGAFEFGRLQGGRSAPASGLAMTGATSRPRESDASFTPGDITHEVSAFHEVSQVLEGRAGWILVSDRASDVGVADRAVDADKVLLLRFSLLAGGEKVSEADLVAIPGQTANLTVPLENGTSLHYRVGTSIDEPTHLSLWAEIRKPTGSEPLAALSTDLRLQSGEKRTAGELSTVSGKYVLNVGFARARLSSGGTP